MSQASKTQCLTQLWALMAGWPRFYLIVGLVDRTIGLAIGRAELIGRKVAVGFFGYFF